MERVIVTGADGFVGSKTVEKLLGNGKEVLAIDLAEKPSRLQSHEGLRYLSADIADTDGWARKVGKNWDTMIHFAWAGSAGPSRMDYELQIKNAITTLACMKAAQGLSCGRFVCAGSIMEREVAAAVATQGSRPGRSYLYGIGKLTAHYMCKTVASDIGIDLIWPMITNAYGEGELSPRFVNTTLRKMIHNEPLQFTAATQNYDFVHIDDVARAFCLIAENGKPFCEYVIGSGRARALKEFILEMQQALAPNNPPLFGDVPFTGTNLPLSAFSAANTESDTSFKAEISFAEGTRRTMAWLKMMEGVSE